MAPRVVLVGPPGAGKTTVGTALAARLGVDFTDTDAVVEAKAGVTIADIFIEHGEERFRELERDAVAASLSESRGVVALGGGAVMDAATRGALHDHHVVFLDVDLADATKRVGFNRDRPLLLGNPRAQLHALMQARRPLYDEVATVTVVTSGRSPDEIVDEIVQALP
jgi:shikimate kinase